MNIKLLLKNTIKKIKEKNETKKFYKKRGLRLMPIGLALSIANGPEIINQEKEKALSNIEKEIKNISNMTLWEYLNHLKEKEKEDNEQNEEAINSESTLD